MEPQRLELRREMLKVHVEDLSLDEVVENFGEAMKVFSRIGGFSLRYLQRAVEILDEAYSKNCALILSFPANIVATGLRGLLADVIAKGFCRAVVTTGGTFDHDIARATGGRYYVGDFELDDEMLRELGLHRLGNILIPLEHYGPLIESFVHRLLSELSRVKTSWSPSELAYESGRRLEDQKSILRACSRKGVPVFSPGLVDSAFGTAVYTFNERARASSELRGIVLDTVADMAKIAEIVYEADCLAGLMLGGGISKHHVIWWAQFRGGLDYAVAVTSAPEWDGSLSGARTREAISWGKIKPSAKHVTVPGDATLLLPIILGAVAKRRLP
ncbi:MAG: deoxyhypusine synthase [Thermofilum sp.]